MERRDVANKSELGRNMAQQRMQQAVSGSSAGSHNMSDGNARTSNHVGNNLTSESQIHHVSQSGSASGSHDAGNSQVQDPEKPTTVEGSGNAGQDQPPQSSAIADSGPIPMRRNSNVGWVASAASAFDAAKDIMEALRNKHPNLASELEVMITYQWGFLILLYSCFPVYLKLIEAHSLVVHIFLSLFGTSRA